MNVAIEELYEWVYAQYGSGIYSVNCRINSRHIAFIQADSNDYGCVILGGYFDTNLSYSKLGNGTWVHNKILLTSDLGYVLAEATTTGSEAVVVSQAPNSPFFIPVIIGHSMANLVKEYVFWDGSKWMFISDTAQTTAIRFYKYPV